MNHLAPSAQRKTRRTHRVTAGFFKARSLCRVALHGLEPLTCGVDPSYQLPIGDLVEYWDDYGNLRAGKISHAYGPLHGRDEGQPCEIRAGYGITGDDSESDQSMFADPERLSLRSDLADARACNAFQAFLAGVLAAPRGGRRPKSPYPL